MSCDRPFDNNKNENLVDDQAKSSPASHDAPINVEDHEDDV